ncbi:MAG: protein TolR [Deltaproteobacteria bacterium]|nr:protein TolR [Deltaproteobacteria bacterium]MBW1813447.1 protein TolR [Deltaproteobacteria bacterium]MBW1847277.1 protein TolR [Deltaproteobacteria bacterium]MBW2179910.1 protein TolR [Deltaproteobacteria bacterium]MBW2364829.1 protein TolR [Deltaproteobacteria bacterium]
MTPTSRDNGFMSDINVTPFVDVMLVLLIIFMVTAPMMMQGMDIDLPEATADSIGSEKEPLIITIDKENQVYINNYKVPIDFLQEKLIKIRQGRADSEVYLKADKEISYGMVVQVMSLIKGAGIDKLGMVTEPDDFKQKNKKKT